MLFLALVFVLHTSIVAAESVHACCLDADCVSSQCVSAGCMACPMPAAVGATGALALAPAALKAGTAMPSPRAAPVAEIWTPPD